jgi:ubiquinone/menaquinone biosynthesis C-methylase UbiE/DNA-binding transcriptional ArsR family regulator
VAIKMAGRLNSGNEGGWLAAHSVLQLPLKRIKISLYTSLTSSPASEMGPRPTPMLTPAHLPFEALHGALKAAAEATRLRILALLGEAELTVSDLTAILRQSQPRISRHLRLLVEAGLVQRFREGSWAFFRLGEREDAAKLARELVARLDPDDATLARDRERLTAVRAQRASAAQTYFRRHAAQWDRIRKLHVADEAVEEAIVGALAEPPIRALLDLGTGTGRMLELFGPQIERGLGLDLSLDMLALARARLDRAALRHCSVRQGDIYDLALPKDSFDAVVIHQVLHFLDDGARAIHEAARVLRPAGRLLVVDFAPHDLEFLRDEHAHRRLGFAPETVTQWMKAAGLDVMLQQSLAPEPASEGKIAVSLWLGRDPRITLAAPAREVA